MKVLIAGGSGVLGKRITRILSDQGHEVGWLTRIIKTENPHVKQFVWNPAENQVDQMAINWTDAIINLAGESIGEISWTQSGKDKILNSRIDSVRVLNKAIRLRPTQLVSFVGVSGAGYYGNSSSSPHPETDTAGSDFPATVALKWESEYLKIKETNPSHFTILRLAVVLSKKGGALPKIVQPIRWGIGSVLGTGDQPFNWIHLDDAARIFSEALDWDGIFNVSAPELVSNRTLTETIAQCLNRPLLLPAVPSFVLKLALGDRSGLVLEGNVSDITKLEQKGFVFRFKTLKSALENLLKSGS